ncbi:BspA family leucine-rich repeat surface protein, partial [Vibrio coralliilyticus]
MNKYNKSLFTIVVFPLAMLLTSCASNKKVESDISDDKSINNIFRCIDYTSPDPIRLELDKLIDASPKNQSAIESFDTSSITDMTCLFDNADIAGYNLSIWDVSNVISMASTFLGSNFDGDI